MIHGRQLTLQREIDLIRSLEQSFRREIHREAERGFTTLRWTKADLSEFIFGWDSGKSITLEAVFLALLRRRMMKRYGVAVAGSGDSRWGTDSDWAAFEAAAAAWLDDRLSLPIDSAESRRNARTGAEVKRLVEEHLAGLGPTVIRLSRELSMVESDSQTLSVRSYFSAGRSGFSYWQDILLPGASKASIRESYHSMFGLSSQTELRDLHPSGVEEAAAFVIEQTMKLVSYVHGADQQATLKEGQ